LRKDCIAFGGGESNLGVEKKVDKGDQNGAVRRGLFPAKNRRGVSPASGGKLWGGGGRRKKKMLRGRSLAREAPALREQKN